MKAFNLNLYANRKPPVVDDWIIVWVCEKCEKNAFDKLNVGSSFLGRYVDVSAIHHWIPLDILFGEDKNERRE